MKIGRVYIKGYRNIQEINVALSDVVVLLGENNSGKSNFLRALSLPFYLDDVWSYSKRLSFEDFNRSNKKAYYNFIKENRNNIAEGKIDLNAFANNIPNIVVEIDFNLSDDEYHLMKNFSYEIKNEEIKYGIKYEYKVNDPENLYAIVRKIVNRDDFDIDTMQQNLLPVDEFEPVVSVPGKGRVSYEMMRIFRYIYLEAERDNFSKTRREIGSKSLVNLIKSSLNKDRMVDIEKQYNNFFRELRTLSNMDDVINWQERYKDNDATEFFSKVDILPNMPTLQSLIGKTKLAYSEEDMSMQGLGYRNMVLLVILMNSLVESKDNNQFSILSVEEPEAHLCINNIRLLSTMINKLISDHNKDMQLFYTTHNVEFINKMDLSNIVVFHDGKAVALKTELSDSQKEYLTKNPNLDLYQLFFSKKCVIFEGISEEMLIRSYIESKGELSDIEMISFHKGFTDIIKIWKIITEGSENKLGIIRDYDYQDKAKANHDIYNDDRCCIRTTAEKTLEPEIVNTGNNYNILVSKYGAEFGWQNKNKSELATAWENAKAKNMYKICMDIRNGELPGFQMPRHIQEVLNFLK